MDDIERLKQENLHLRCVMREAASELLTFWEFHVSDGGRGPHLLLDRLLGIIPTSHDVNPYPNREREVSDAES